MNKMKTFRKFFSLTKVPILKYSHHAVWEKRKPTNPK
jgi:hypothetical protein